MPFVQGTHLGNAGVGSLVKVRREQKTEILEHAGCASDDNAEEAAHT